MLHEHHIKIHGLSGTETEKPEIIYNRTTLSKGSKSRKKYSTSVWIKLWNAIWGYKTRFTQIKRYTLHYVCFVMTQYAKMFINSKIS